VANIILIAHNVRSSHNVGSLLRTADGLGLKSVFLTGYTAYPLQTNDRRLPHIAKKLNDQIHKTALGAEISQKWHFVHDIRYVLLALKILGYKIIGLEQSIEAVKLTSLTSQQNLALIVGREVEGIEPAVLRMTDQIVEIPMLGKKESFNVVQAAAMALFYLRFMV
jgi:23S rRNA (guanosine2251-2'-O)-methyltransferase